MSAEPQHAQIDQSTLSGETSRPDRVQHDYAQLVRNTVQRGAQGSADVKLDIVSRQLLSACLAFTKPCPQPEAHFLNHVPSDMCTVQSAEHCTNYMPTRSPSYPAHPTS